jgi:hypothetical protein
MIFLEKREGFGNFARQKLVRLQKIQKKSIY